MLFGLHRSMVELRNEVSIGVSKIGVIKIDLGFNIRVIIWVGVGAVT